MSPPIEHAAARAPLPPVTAAEAVGDGAWFDQHPNRRFRARAARDGTWLVRRRGDILLRAFVNRTLSHLHDRDTDLGPAWFEPAYPGLLAEKAQRRARKAGVRR
jgi:hypothetical protein